MKKASHLYLHLPFCAKKCSYCAFYTISDLTLMDSYYEALKKDLDQLASAYDVSLKTLYFGGGNPALLGGERVAEIIRRVKKLFGEDIEEITLEANPENVNKEFAAKISEAGVNRISMGLQSFDKQLLNILGRSSRPEDAVKALHILREAGFSNINLDLIYGSPGSTLALLEKDLESLVALNPEHISTYALQVEEGTALKRKIDRAVYELPREELLEEQFEFVIDYLCSQGYQRYEISNYAKKGYESRHNLSYWNYRDTLGAGAAAVYTFQGKRVENVSSVKKYIELVQSGCFPYGEETILSPEEEQVEFIMMNMRKAEGLSNNNYKNRFGKNIEEEYGNWIKKYRDMGLMEVDLDRYYLTKRGLNLSNTILAELL